jgi:hypothetical protein
MEQGDKNLLNGSATELRTMAEMFINAEEDRDWSQIQRYGQRMKQIADALENLAKEK